MVKNFQNSQFFSFITYKLLFMSSKAISSLVPPSLSSPRMFLYSSHNGLLIFTVSKVLIIPTMSLLILSYHSIHPSKPSSNYKPRGYSFAYPETNRWPDISPVNMGFSASVENCNSRSAAMGSQVQVPTSDGREPLL